MQNLPLPYRNILIIKPGAIGDLLQMTPVIRALNTSSPEARISMLVGSESSTELFRHNPRIAKLFVYDREKTDILRLWQELRSRRFDLVLNFQRSNPRAWFLAAAAFPCRVLVYHKSEAPGVHAVSNYLRTIEPLGIPASDLRLELFLDNASRAFAQRLLEEHGLDRGPVIAVNPGASHPIKQWPAERFAELADLIAARTPARAVVIGGPGDAALAQEVVVRSRSKPANLAGRTSLLQLGAVLERCAVLVSGDTGPLHLATAVGTKVIGLFGSVDPARTGPVGPGHQVIQAEGVACVPCRSKTCTHPVPLACMEQITAERVFDAVRGLAPISRERNGPP
jgi:ADP-heptose:LPS heptosyltransferase